MNLERQNQLLGILRNRYAMFGKNEQPMGVQGYNDFYWDEITELASLHPEYVRYTPPNPKGNPMYETGKHDVLPAIMNLPQNIGKSQAQTPTETPASEAPAAPQVEAPVDAPQESPQVEMVSDVLLRGYARQSIEKDERIAALEAQLQKAERVAAAFDSELGKEQQKRIKLEADNAAYERIVIQAGKDFEALRNENARIRLSIYARYTSAKEQATKWGMSGDSERERWFSYVENVLGDILQMFNADNTTPTPPSQEAPATPKFAVGDKVRIVSHIDQLTGKVDAIVTDSFAGVSYRVVRDYSPVTLWHAESDLEALS